MIINEYSYDLSRKCLNWSKVYAEVYVRMNYLKYTWVLHLETKLFNIHNIKNNHTRICSQLQFSLIINLLRNPSRNSLTPVHKVINFNFNIIKSKNLVSNLIKKNSESEIGLLKKTPSISDFLLTIALISLRKLRDVKKRYSIDCQKYCEKGLRTNVGVTIKNFRWSLRTKLTKSLNAWK